MKRTTIVFGIAILVAGAFSGGYWLARRGVATQTSERKILYWVDPMHPKYKSDKPGIAPDCGMKLEPVYADGGAGSETTVGQASDTPLGTVQIDAQKQQLIGVAFSTAEITSTGEVVRAVGKVVVDETRISRVHPKIEGWVSRTFVDFTGQLVAKGDPMLTLYSPEMLASQQEFVLALRARDAMKGGGNREALENSEALVAAARRRLELWDLSPQQVEDLERVRTPVRDITLYSPASGYVTSRNVFPNQKVAPETELYAIADLSQVWIMADVFEIDLAKIGLGQAAWVTTPQGSFSARASYVQPQIDPATRTAKIRLDAANPGLRLKPEMFVNVEFRLSSPGRVTVPADAVVNTGTRQTVFVDRGDGRLEPRAVEMGDRMGGDRVQILRGLRAGERVVSSGAFLVDSEAQLKGAVAGAVPSGTVTPGEHRHD